MEIKYNNPGEKYKRPELIGNGNEDKEVGLIALYKIPSMRLNIQLKTQNEESTLKCVANCQCYMLCLVSHSVMSDCLRPHGLQPARLLCPWGFSRQEYWRGLPCPPPGDPPNTGNKPRSLAVQVDSLPSEPPGKSKKTGVGSLFLLPGIFLTQELNWGLLHCRQILYN